MPTPVGYANVSINMTLAGDSEPYACTFGVETVLSSFTALEHANHIFGAWTASILADQSDELTLESVTCRFGQDGADDLIINSDITPTVGGSTSDKLPQNCAVLIRKNTALGGRRNRGRMYVPSWVNDNAVSMTGVITPTDVTSKQTAADLLLSRLATDPVTSGLDTPMVILHQSVTPITPTPVTSLTLASSIATQRRRLRK